jgi:cell cycle arrest protein BUB3
VSCLQWSPENSVLYSGAIPFLVLLRFVGSWDSSVGVWDARSPTNPAPSVPASGKVYSLSLTPTRLVVATSDRHITVYDKRNLSVPEQIRESPLRYMTRQISCLPSGDGFVIGSIEVSCSFFFIFSAVT